MSIRNVALDSRVYEKLARFKKQSESFSKAIDRILTRIEHTHTGQDVIGQLSGFPDLKEPDAKAMLNVVRESREGETWEPHDLP